MYNLKINSDQGKDDTSSNRASNKPNAPRGDKDFKKILGDQEKDEENEEAKFLASLEGPVDYDEIAQARNLKKKQPSLFDLSKGKIKENADSQTSDVVNMASADELPMESPTSIFKNLALKEKAGKAQEESLFESKGLNDLDEEKGQTTARFSQESVDLTYVNPMALSPVAGVNDQKMDKLTPSQKMTMQELVDAIAKAVATAESQGKTDTIVTLKHPPLLAGSNLILTSYESAKGEFNIRFENLTQQAKAFIDMQQNQDSLRFALQEKGYAVHIVVATTEIEAPQIAAQAEQPRRDQDPQEQEQKRQQRRNPTQEEEA